MRRRKRTRGFTLVELIIVIAILAILAAILIPGLIGYISTAQESTCLANRATAKRLLLSETALHGLDETEAAQFLSQNSLPPGKICPAGGTVSLKKDGDTWTVSCSIHQNGNTAKSTVEIVNDHVQDLMDKAFADYFKDRPSSKELDSTGTNFGTAIRRDLAELLNSPQDQADQYDVRVYRQTVTGKNEYYVYVFDSLGNHSSGDRIAATRYVFRSGADGSPVLDDSATATGTGQVATKLIDNKDEVKYLNTSEAFWQQDP